MSMNITNANSNENIDSIKSAFKYYRQMLTQGMSRIEVEHSKEQYEARIRAKLKAGKRLTAKELRYLKENNPTLYLHAIRIETKRRNVERELQNASSKEEVEEIRCRAMAAIGEKDPVKEYMRAAVQEAVEKFKESDEYSALPEQEEDLNPHNNKKTTSIIYETVPNSYQMAFAETDAIIYTDFSV